MEKTMLVLAFLLFVMGFVFGLGAGIVLAV